MSSGKAAAREIGKHCKTVYKQAITEAKRLGNTTTLFRVGAEVVTQVLKLKDEMTCGVEPGGVQFADMDYNKTKTVPRTLEDGSVIEEEVIIAEYTIRSQQRDQRCTLELKDGNDTHKITEVSK